MTRSNTVLEQTIQNEGRLAIGSLPDVRLYRNNVGALPDKRGVLVRYGLAVGSADTIGLVAPRGRMLSIEWKVPGYVPSGAKELERERQQQNWRDQINGMGGIAIRADSAEQGLWAVALARRPEVRLESGTVFPSPELVWLQPVRLDWELLLRDWELKKPQRKQR
jgi:hypothetical protein